ncbi:MAG TPA: TetR/AcrR family transcriptional regulator [Caulobacteraceae bacterium]|nr:TetR/AcrR family transcriptional regulator [Caulobacteraceae bacterium]
MNRVVLQRHHGRAAAPSSRRAEAKARTRSKILQAARSLFMDRGYDAATIRDIAARAELSTGAVFASFSDKADLFNAVLQQDMERQAEPIRLAASADLPLEAALMGLFRLAYGFHLEQLPLLQAATGLSWSQGLTGPLGNRPAYSLALAAVGEILSRGKDRGELAPEADGALVAEMLWDAYLSNYRRALFEDWGLDQLSERVARQIRVVIAGAAASAAPP